MRRLGGILRRRWEGIRLEDESTLTRPVGHPQQRDVGQGRVRVAAADVAVNPGEPHLPQFLPAGAGLLVPQRRREHCPLLVDGQRLEGALDPGAELSVVEFPLVVDSLHDRIEPARPERRDAKSADRVPHADELNAWLV